MSSIWVASYVTLWAFVLLLTIAVIVMMRIVGQLYERIPPRVARFGSAGPNVGDRAPTVDMQDIAGKSVRIPSETATLIVFVSPTCQTCGALASVIRSLARTEKHSLTVVMSAISGTEKQHKEFIARHHLVDVLYVADTLSGLYSVPTAPYAVLLDSRGIVKAKGLVNAREDLESLFNADRLGFATLEEAVSSHHDKHGGMSGESMVPRY